MCVKSFDAALTLLSIPDVDQGLVKVVLSQLDCTTSVSSTKAATIRSSTIKSLKSNISQQVVHRHKRRYLLVWCRSKVSKPRLVRKNTQDVAFRFTLYCSRLECLHHLPISTVNTAVNSKGFLSVCRSLIHERRSSYLY